MKELILIGAGGHCKSCIDVIEMQGVYSIKGLIDSKLAIRDKVCGYQVLGNDDVLSEVANDVELAFISVGQISSPELRIQLFNKVQELGFKMARIISPLAHVAKSATIGDGSIVMHGSIVNACASVGDNTIINTRALVEHDAKIGNHCHISTGAIVNGGSKIEDNSFVGSGAVVVQQAVVLEGSFLKAGRLHKGIL